MNDPPLSRTERFLINSIGWILCAAATLAAAALLGLAIDRLATPARAHDHNRPGLDGWYPTLRSPAGSNCCDGPKVDAVHLADVDWKPATAVTGSELTANGSMCRPAPCWTVPTWTGELLFGRRGTMASARCAASCRGR